MRLGLALLCLALIGAASVEARRIARNRLSLTCDNKLGGVYVNGKKVTGIKNGKDWTKTDTVALPNNAHTIAIECIDQGVIAGILASSTSGIVTDNKWKCTSKHHANWFGVNYDDRSWKRATVVGGNGARPWNKRPGISSRAKWIWTSGFKGKHMRVYCRRSIGPKRVKTSNRLSLTCDNKLGGVYVNGKKVTGIKNGKDWTKTDTVALPNNAHTIAIECIDQGVIAGILASSTSGIVTDNKWKCTSKHHANWFGVNYDDRSWKRATVVGGNGARPWNKRPGISSRAKWIWTSGFKGKHMRVYCRRSIGGPKRVKTSYPTLRFSTPKKYHYRDTGLVISKQKAIVFGVRTTNDVHVALTDKRNTYKPNHMYEIVIGGWGNTKSVIRKGKQGKNLATASTKNILSRKQLRRFWISWKGGVISVGRGYTIGQNRFMSFQDKKPVKIRTVGISTWANAAGSWEFPTKYRFKTSSKSVGYKKILKGVLYAGHKVIRRPITDTARRWTFIDRDQVDKDGVLYGFKFYANVAGRPLRLSVFRKMGRSGNYKSIYAFNVPGKKIKKGMNMITLWKKKLRIRKGDLFGFTWSKYGVVGYTNTKAKKGYYFERNITPGKSAIKYNNQHTNRNYAFQGIYVPYKGLGSKKSSMSAGYKKVLKGVLYAGHKVIRRPKTDTARRWTFIDMDQVVKDGVLYGFKFYANVAGRPLRLSVFRKKGKSGSYKTKFTYNIPGKKIRKGLNTVALFNKKFRVKKGDLFGFTWSKYGVIGYTTSKAKRPFYYERNITPGKSAVKYNKQHGNRLYAFKGIYVPYKGYGKVSKKVIKNYSKYGLRKATKMAITCDNDLKGVYINGKKVKNLKGTKRWESTKYVTLPAGTRTVGIACLDKGVIAGILASTKSGAVTDGSWRCSDKYQSKWYSPSFKANKWKRATVIAKNGAAPWRSRPGISSNAKWIWTSGFKGKHKMVYCRKTFGPAPVTKLRELRITTKSYKYRDIGLKVSKVRGISFSVKAGNSANIALTSRRNYYKANKMYEIVIGGWGNKKSAIRRKASGKTLALVNTKDIISSKEKRNFWISWNKGKITVGRGSLIGQNVFMSYKDPKPIKVNYVGVSTLKNSIGKWRFPTRFRYSPKLKSMLKGVMYVGHKLMKRPVTDVAKAWTFIDRRKVYKPARLFGVRFYANVAGRPLSIGIYRPTGKSRQFTNVFKYNIPGSKIKKGLNNVSLWKKKFNLKKGDSFGFTWSNFGVVGFTYTKKKGYYYEQNAIPKAGKKFGLADRHTNRKYSFQGLYVPFKKYSSKPIKLPKVKKVCSSKADIVFALDGSGSVRASNFRLMKAFVKHLTNHFKVSSDEARVSVIRYSSKSKVLFGLKKYNSNKKVNQAIDNMGYYGGVTRTDYAIRDAYKTLHREGRRDTPNMIVVVTDGNSTVKRETERWSKFVQKKGLEVFSLGIGRGIGLSELKAIASKPSADHMFHVKSFKSLANVIQPLAGAACKAAKIAAKKIKAKKTSYKSTTLSLTCDNQLRRLYVNGKRMNGLKGVNDWKRTKSVKLNSAIKSIAIECVDKGVIAGILASSSDGVVTDKNWKCTRTYEKRWYARNYNARSWKKATVIGRNGMIPWSKRPGISSKAQWIWTSGFRAKKHARVYCRWSPPASSKPNPIRVKPGKPVCSSKADIIFVLDGSGSVKAKNFKLMKGFTKHLIGKFRVARDQLRVGLVQFSTRSRVEFNLKKYSNVKSVYSAIDKMRYMRGYTRTDLALKDAYDMIKTYGRKTTPNLVVLVTDGKSTAPSRTVRAARYLHKKKLPVFALGIGKGIGKKELKAIASKPYGRYMYHVKNFKSLKNVIKPLSSAACKAITEAKPRPIQVKPVNPSRPYVSKPQTKPAVERPEPGVSTKLPTGIKVVGPAVVKRPLTDKASRYTFIYKKIIPAPAKIYGVQFYANVPKKPLRVTLYRPIGKLGKFKAIEQMNIPAELVKKGLNQLVIPKKHPIFARKGDRLGFTWTKGGVVAYSKSNRNSYYTKNAPTKEGDVSRFSTNHGKRVYSLRVLYRPIPKPFVPKGLVPVGQKASRRPLLDIRRVGTVIQRPAFKYPGRVYGVQFYAKKERPIKIGLYRPIPGSKLKFKTIGRITIPASRVQKGVNLVNVWPKRYFVKKGDHIGFSWLNKPVVPYTKTSSKKIAAFSRPDSPSKGVVKPFEDSPSRKYSFRALYVPVKPVKTVFDIKLPKGVVPVGNAPTPRVKNSVDTSRVWTFIDKERFPKSGRLFGAQFYAGKGRRPLTIGIFRPTGKPTEFKRVFKYYLPATRVKKGFNNVNFIKRKFVVKKGDSLGFTWTRRGVVNFQYVKDKGHYYEKSVVPSNNKPQVYNSKHSNREYGIRALFIPFPKSARPPRQDDTVGPKPDFEGEKTDDKYFDLKPRTLPKPRPRPLGVESGLIPNKYFRASTYKIGSEAYKARPGVAGGWMPSSKDTSPWLQVDLGKPMPIHGLGTLGSSGPSKCYVKTYLVQVSTDGKNFRHLLNKRNGKPRVFIGNNDQGTWKRHCLHRYYGEPVNARIVRFEPQSSSCVGMRVELYGFRDPKDPWLLKALKYDAWTRKITGCMCYFDASRFDCACCQRGGCQCSSRNNHQCVQCGYGSQCGIPEVKPKIVEVDPWTRTKGGCTCHFDKTRKDCACCQRYGCQCGEENPNQCVQCGHPEACGTREDVFGPNKFCTPKVCPAKSILPIKKEKFIRD